MARNAVDLSVGGRRITGLAGGPGAEETPLLIALHGGGFSSQYFDVPGYSLLDRAEANGFATFALDRPGYAGSDPLPEGDVTFARSAAVLDDAIARLWADHGGRRPGVVIVSHSIGSAIAVHIAARKPSWPLLGISLHGVNETSPNHIIAAMTGMPAYEPVVFEADALRALTFGPESTYDTAAFALSVKATAPAPFQEIHEIAGRWQSAAPEVCGAVAVPVQYTLAEHDGLWIVSEERVATFAARFTSAPWVDARLQSGMGHNGDHHHLSHALHLRQLAFAAECAVAAHCPVQPPA